MTIPQDLAHLSTEELISEVERRAYERGRHDGYTIGYSTGYTEGHEEGHRRGYDAGRQYSYRQRKNDALRNEGINLVRAQLATIRSQIDDILDLSGLGPYTKTKASRQGNKSQQIF